MPDTVPLRDRITAKLREVDLARKDGCKEWLERANDELNELLNQIPRTRQPN